MGKLLRRKIDSVLAAWKERPDHKPLIVKGGSADWQDSLHFGFCPGELSTSDRYQFCGATEIQAYFR